MVSHPLSRDEIVHSISSRSAITTLAGAADGSTLVDAGLIGATGILNKTVLIVSGAAALQMAVVTNFTPATGAMAVSPHFTAQILDGVIYRLLNFSLNSLADGLIYKGTVTAVPGANQFTIPGLAGLGAGKFDGANSPYSAFVFRDAAGAAAPPQGELAYVTAYDPLTGIFATDPFTAAVGVGDEILIVSPLLSTTVTTLLQHGGALAYIGQCPAGMVASTNNIFCPNLAGLGDNTFVRGYQMIVLRNASAPGNPPEMEMRAITNFGSANGQFATVAFSANLEAGDTVLVIHNSLATQISAYGIADAGSGVALVRDSARTEANDWWNGQTVMMLSGAAQGQKRPIADFIAATDDIVPSPDFDAAVAAGDLYVILAHYNPIVPRVANGAANYLTSDVVGRKDDTAIVATDNVSSLVRYEKGLMDAKTRQLFTMDFWSVPAVSLTVPAFGAAATQALPNVVVANLPAGAAIVNAMAMAKFRIIENSNVAANRVHGAQKIQIQKGGGGGYVDCISLTDLMFALAAGPLREGGDVLMGDIDVHAKVTANDTYNLQWLNAAADVASLVLYDIQTGIRIWFSV